MKTILRVAVMALVCSGTSVHGQPAHQELWLAPLAQEFNGKRWGAADFLKMFADDTKWQTVAQNTNVFKFYPTFIGTVPDAALRHIFENLKRRGIKTALEGSVLTPEEGCGGKVSGDTGEFTVRLAERIRKLGGTLDYLAMNEPLLHAFRQKQRLCAANIEAMTAANVAKTIRAIREIFPNIKVGDIEAIGTWTGTEGLLDSIVRWTDAFEAETGEKLAFMDADIGWILPWVDIVGRLGEEMHKRNIPFGVIYNGVDTDLSDEAWISDAEQHFVTYENSGFRRPDRAIFQSWAEFPRHILPEDGRYTLTSLVLRYLRHRTVLSAESRDSRLTGKLLEEETSPLASEPVSVFSRPLQGYGPAGWRSTKGVVPEGAVNASFTLSMNAECACKAQSSIVLQKFDYKERNGRRPADVDSNFRDWTAKASGKIAAKNGSVEIVTGREEQAQFQSPLFAVTSGVAFDARAFFKATFGTDAGGLGILKFFDAADKEVRRTYIMLRPNWTKVAEAETKADGSFVVPAKKGLNFSTVAWKVIFNGNDKLRPSQYESQKLPSK